MKPIRMNEGQALAEFLVLFLAISPLLLLFPLLAKYQDISHATQMASRYVAFEATTRNDRTSTWKPEAELANEVRTRFFGGTGDPIVTGFSGTASANPFWRGPSGAPLIANPNTDVILTFGSARGPSHGSAFEPTVDGKPFQPHESFDLNDSGIYGANVEVAIAALPSGLRAYAPFDQLNLNVTRTTAVLIDGWAARSPLETEQRISHDPMIFAEGPLQALGATLDASVSGIDAVGALHGPLLGQLDFWRDVVPSDRLK